LPIDTGEHERDGLTLEKVLAEKKLFDLTVSFEKVDLQNSPKSWTEPGM
jgi:hypothetical protein